MSISGSLDDVSVADVMQFIHLGRRTGSLLLERDGERARIGFHAGKLVSAQGPRQAKVGDLLVDAGLVSRGALEAAVASQRSGEDPRSLGQILVGGGELAPQDLRAVLVRQIEGTVADLVSWDCGSFQFVVGGPQPVDDIGLYPGELVPDADINTQMILLEAARIFDERNRSDAVSAPAGRTPLATAPDLRQALMPRNDAGRTAALAPAAGSGGVTVKVATDDGGLVAALEQAAARLGAGVERAELGRLGEGAADEEAAIAVVDLRRAQAGFDDLVRLHLARPRLPLVALVDPGGSALAAAYQAGAVAVLPTSAALPACLENLLCSRREGKRPGADGRLGVARLRRILGDLRSGFISATAALSLMHIISESVERAVLFLARSDGFKALGAFGSSPDGRPLAEQTRGLRFDLEADHALSRCFAANEALASTFADAQLPAAFARIIGPPRNGQVVLFPVPGARRVIAVVYADNGDRREPVEDIEILEIATAQVGMAFENELLRREAYPAGA